MTGTTARLLLGAALAVAALVAVEWSLRSAGPTPGVGAAMQIEPEPPPLGRSRALPSGAAWLIYLLPQDAEVAAAIRPLVEIDSEGGLRLVRPAPIAAEPRGESWLAAGVLLPDDGIDGLGPRARATLLTVLRQWRGDLAVSLRRRVLTPPAASPGSLDLLLRFAR